MRAEGVVLAAGLSSRTTPENKMALDLAGMTLLQRSIGSMRPFCARIFVVTGANAPLIAGILRDEEGVLLLHNPDYASGMYSSVKAGLLKTGADEVFLLPGDCPFVTPPVYAALSAAQGDIAVPVWRGRRGHPVLLRRPAVNELLSDTAAESLHHFISARRVTQAAVDCPGILKDIDTMVDYLQARRQMAGLCDRR